MNVPPAVLVLFLTLSLPASAELREATSLFDSDRTAFLEHSNCGPNTICGGVLAAPPRTCVFNDANKCRGKAYGEEKWEEYGASVSDLFGQSQSGVDDNPEMNEVVALINDDAKVLCSGILVSSNLVLTAAHCLGSGATHVFVGSRIAKTGSGEVAHDGWLFEINGESTYFSSKKNTSCYIATFEGEKATHIEKDDLDLGLVRFSNSDTISSTFIFQLPSSDIIMDYSTEFGGWSWFFAAGFGASEHRDSGGEKRYAELTSVTECWADRSGTCQSSTYEYISTGDADTCFGDSGGELLGVGYSYIALLGVTSRAATSGNSNLCGKGGVYTSIYPQGLGRFVSYEGIAPSEFDDFLQCSTPWSWLVDSIGG